MGASDEKSMQTARSKYMLYPYYVLLWGNFAGMLSPSVHILPQRLTKAPAVMYAMGRVVMVRLIMHSNPYILLYTTPGLFELTILIIWKGTQNLVRKELVGWERGTSHEEDGFGSLQASRTPRSVSVSCTHRLLQRRVLSVLCTTSFALLFSLYGVIYDLTWCKRYRSCVVNCA